MCQYWSTDDMLWYQRTCDICDIRMCSSRRWAAHKGGAWMNRINGLTKEPPKRPCNTPYQDSPLSFRKWNLPDIKSTSDLIWLPRLHIMRKQCFCLKLSIYIMLYQVVSTLCSNMEGYICVFPWCQNTLKISNSQGCISFFDWSHHVLSMLLDSTVTGKPQLLYHSLNY